MFAGGNLLLRESFEKFLAPILHVVHCRLELLERQFASLIALTFLRLLGPPRLRVETKHGIFFCLPFPDGGRAFPDRSQQAGRDVRFRQCEKLRLRQSFEFL